MLAGARVTLKAPTVASVTVMRYENILVDVNICLALYTAVQPSGKSLPVLAELELELCDSELRLLLDELLLSALLELLEKGSELRLELESELLLLLRLYVIWLLEDDTELDDEDENIILPIDDDEDERLELLTLEVEVDILLLLLELFGESGHSGTPIASSILTAHPSLSVMVRHSFARVLAPTSSIAKVDGQDGLFDGSGSMAFSY